MHSHSYFITNIKYFHCDFITFLLNFYFEVTLFVVETTAVIIEVSQVVPFITIKTFRIINVNNTMYDYTIDVYCYHHHYFSVCALQFISFIYS